MDKEERKVNRVPLGTHKLKLQLSNADAEDFKRRGWTTRWVNDVGGRIPQALAGGYKFAEPEEATSLGESAIHAGNKAIGNQVRQVVSKGKDVTYAYLMKIRTKFYDEDQQAKWAAIDENERGLIRGNAGGAEIDKTYLPEGVRQAVTIG